MSGIFEQVSLIFGWGLIWFHLGASKAFKLGYFSRLAESRGGCKEDPYHIFSLFGFLSSTVNLIVNIVNNNNSNNNNNK